MKVRNANHGYFGALINPLWPEARLNNIYEDDRITFFRKIITAHSENHIDHKQTVNVKY
jgi:hypothetical protein